MAVFVLDGLGFCGECGFGHGVDGVVGLLGYWRRSDSGLGELLGCVGCSVVFVFGLINTDSSAPPGRFCFVASFHGLRDAFGIASPVATGLRPFGARGERGGREGLERSREGRERR